MRAKDDVLRSSRQRLATRRSRCSSGMVALLRRKGLTVQTGVFGARMQVRLVNEGPVTILLDSRKLF